MIKPVIATEKPSSNADNSFFDQDANLDQALHFATNADEPKKRGRPFKDRKGKQQPELRENFDVTDDVRRQVNVFIAQSKRFKSKKEFYLQCVLDGLKKYKE